MTRFSSAYREYKGKYKTVSYTPKDPAIISKLKEYTGFDKHPQGFIRECLFKVNYVSSGATSMMSVNNFGVFDKTVKVSFYEEDHARLKATAAEKGTTIQKLITAAITTVMLADEIPAVREELQQLAIERKSIN